MPPAMAWSMVLRFANSLWVLVRRSDRHTARHKGREGGGPRTSYGGGPGWGGVGWGGWEALGM